jgi:large subunit ribosomal protein L16
MLMPSRVKFRKQQRGRMKGLATSGNKVSFGQYGLKSQEAAWVTARQIEAARVAINRHLKKGGKLWVRIFPDKPVSKKPAETRMGKGKGAPEFWVVVIKPGRVMFELDGVPADTAKAAFRSAGNKLPVKCTFVVRHEI